MYVVRFWFHDNKSMRATYQGGSAVDLDMHELRLLTVMLKVSLSLIKPVEEDLSHFAVGGDRWTVFSPLFESGVLQPQGRA